MNPTTPEHDLNDAGNCPACATGRFAPVAAAAAPPAFQYGVREDGDVRWPDSDDELFFRHLPGDSHGGYISATDLPALQVAAKLSGVTLVQRTLGPVEDVRAPLPTTLGSVARSDHARPGDTETFVLTADGWTRTERCGYRSAQTRLAALAASPTLEILFDAGAAA